MNNQSRRNFFRSLLREAFTLQEELQGKPRYQLSELGKLPDVHLGQIQPVVPSNVAILRKEDCIYARRHNRNEEILLFPANEQNMFIIDRFSNGRTIDEIARALSDHFGIPLKTAFASVRDLFLLLIDLQVCLPGNPIG